MSQVKCLEERQSCELDPANEGSDSALFSTDLGIIFESFVGDCLGAMLRGEGPRKPEFAHDIVCMQPLMMYKDLIE